MQESLFAAWEVLKKLLFTSEYAKSPMAGIVVGVVLLMAKDAYDRRQARRVLLVALQTEASTAWHTVHDLLRRFPTKAEADKLVKGVEDKNLDFETLDSIPAGWLLSAPSFSVADTIAKLKPHQATVAIEYFDAWTRLVERERRLTTTYMKLVELTPQLSKSESHMQLREVACQVRGSLKKLLTAAKDLAVARDALEVLATRSLKWPLVHPRHPKRLEAHALEYPRDWDAVAPEPAALCSGNEPLGSAPPAEST